MILTNRAFADHLFSLIEPHSRRSRDTPYAVTRNMIDLEVRPSEPRARMALIIRTEGMRHPIETEGDEIAGRGQVMFGLMTAAARRYESEMARREV